MSTLSSTTFTLVCNGQDEDHPCPSRYGPASTPAEHLRRKAKRAGWRVSVPNPDGSRDRLDFCPEHRGAPKETR